MLVVYLMVNDHVAFYSSFLIFSINKVVANFDAGRQRRVAMTAACDCTAANFLRVCLPTTFD